MGVKVRFNIDDYMALPESGARHQLVDGDLVVSPSPSTQHQRICKRLFLALVICAEKGGLGEAFVGPIDVIFSNEDVIVPDLLYVSKAHASIIQRDGIHGAPDLVVEVLLPSNRTIDLTTKKKRYGKFGVPELWIADPEAHTLALYRLQDDPEHPQRMFSVRETFASPTVPGLSIDLAGVLTE